MMRTLATDFCMLRLFKRIGCLALLAAGVQSSHGFALLGPINEPYQDIVIGYSQGYRRILDLVTGQLAFGDPIALQDVGAPKNIGEEYRYNKPVLYYSFNQNFLEFFGPEGAGAVDQAFG